MISRGSTTARLLPPPLKPTKLMLPRPLLLPPSLLLLLLPSLAVKKSRFGLPEDGLIRRGTRGEPGSCFCSVTETLSLQSFAYIDLHLREAASLS